MPTVLVTGASRGLGLELVRQYGADGWDVLACARAPDRASGLGEVAAQLPGRVAIHPLDVTDFGAIDALARRLQGVSIDVLINNAGTMGSRGSSFGASDFAQWDGIFRLNTFAPMKMAEAFVGHIAASRQRKIVSLSTIMASIARNNMGGFYAYRASKAALNAIMVSLSIDLARRHGVVAAVLHPGWVRTDMGGPRAEIDPRTSVAGLRRVIAGLTREGAGRFWAYDGSELLW
ncbi:MAG TPA: SDR family oxidoreductase [Steroidobacteraceae bacterium]|nr:SDR family oxidoreductase [Steroidobacteraceae bacterium]